MTIELTSSAYWKEIESLKCIKVQVKDQLKSMVNSWLSGTIPPSATNSMIKDLQLSGIEYIDIELTEDRFTQKRKLSSCFVIRNISGYLQKMMMSVIGGNIIKI